jgi:hypothetical protein
MAAPETGVTGGRCTYPLEGIIEKELGKIAV